MHLNPLPQSSKQFKSAILDSHSSPFQTIPVPNPMCVKDRDWHSFVDLLLSFNRTHLEQHWFIQSICVVLLNIILHLSWQPYKMSNKSLIQNNFYWKIDKLCLHKYLPFQKQRSRREYYFYLYAKSVSPTSHCTQRPIDGSLVLKSYVLTCFLCKVASFATSGIFSSCPISLKNFSCTSKIKENWV